MTTETQQRGPSVGPWTLLIIAFGLVLAHIDFLGGGRLSAVQTLIGLAMLITGLKAMRGEIRLLDSARVLAVVITLLKISALLLELLITFPSAMATAVDGVIFFLGLWFLFELCRGLSVLALRMGSPGSARWLGRCALMFPWGMGGIIVLRMLPWDDWGTDMALLGLIALPFSVLMTVALYAFLFSMLKLIGLTDR